MMTITNQELFVNAFLEAEQITNNKYLNKENFTFEFSQKFENKMQKLIAKENRIRFSTRRKISKALLAAIIAITVMFTGLMSVSATRAPFIEFVKKIFPQYNQIALSEESTPSVSTIETEYTLTDLPERYDIDTYQKNDYNVFTIWKNTNGEEIVFQQSIIDADISIDNEHNYKKVLINGYEAYLNEYDFNSSLIWNDGNYWFVLNVPNDLNKELVDMAEKISEKN